MSIYHGNKPFCQKCWTIPITWIYHKVFVPIGAMSGQKHFLVMKYWIKGLVGSFLAVKTCLYYKVTICVAIRTNHCIETKAGFKIGLLSVNFQFQVGHFIFVNYFFFCYKCPVRTKVFYYLAYHKAGKNKSIHHDCSTAAWSRPLSLSLATVLGTF